MSDGVGGPRLLPSVRSPSPSRLQSWKEIAGYLQRDERTVRRWEKSEGLPVHRLQHGKSASVFANSAELDAWMADHTTSGPNRLHDASRSEGWRWRGVLWLATAVAATAAVSIGLSFRSRPAEVATVARLATDPGIEMDPRLSPDGERVAYVWDGEAHDNFDIYVRAVAGGQPTRVTNNPAPDYSPAWSPDGASIAFLRQVDVAKVTVLAIPAMGGAERTVTDLPAASWPRWDRPGPFLAWSRDGNWLVAAGRGSHDPVDALLRIEVTTGDTRPLTVPGPGSMGDTAPAISPDGNTLAFSRRRSWSAADLCLLPLSRDLTPAGPVRRLETGSAWNTSPAWRPDGRAVIFSTGTMDAPHLASIALPGAAHSERLAGVGEYGLQPSLANTRDGRMRLVYTQHYESVNIWRQPLGTAPATQLVASAHWSYEPDYSPDGKRIAFLSDRSGFAEIWVADVDGRNPNQWTFLQRPSLGGPKWSPDSRHLAFTAPGRDGSSIYLLEAPGAPPREAPGSYRCGYLAWSPDGRALYFSSNRGGSTQIWRIPREGGEAVQVTTRGGRVPAISADGRYLYYLRLVSTAGDNKLFRMPLTGGDEEQVLDSVDAYSLGSSGIAFKYYRTGPRAEGPYLRFLRFATGHIDVLPNSAKPLRYGVALSPDGRNLLHSQSDYAVSDLMLVDNLP